MIILRKIAFPRPSTPGLRSNLRKLTGISQMLESNFQKAMKVKNNLKKMKVKWKLTEKLTSVGKATFKRQWKLRKSLKKLES